MNLNKIKALRKLDHKVLNSLLEHEIKLYLLLLISYAADQEFSGVEFGVLCRALGPEFSAKDLLTASGKFAGLGLGKISLSEKPCLKKTTLVSFKPNFQFQKASSL